MAKKKLPEKLNICIISRKFPILGRAADHGFLWPLAKKMASKGHSVTVLSARSPQARAEIRQDGVTAKYLMESTPASSRKPKDFPNTVKEHFLELHEKEPFHLVHSIDNSGYRIGKMKKQLEIVMTYDVEATQMAQIFSILGMAQETLGSLIRTGLAVTYKFLSTFYGSDRRLLKTADGVFVTSPAQAIALERYYLFPDSRTFNVPYGLEIGDLESKTVSEELRTELKLPESAQTVVTITDMTEMEELKNLLLAFQKVAIKKADARLIIVGHGPLLKRIEFEALQLALGNRVIFAGAIRNTDIPKYISLGSVFVNLSARTSGFEPSMLEAMAQEKVIVGSEVSPISTIVEDGVDGFLIRPADTQSLANLVLDIFNGVIVTHEIGRRGRQKVLNLFDTEKMVDQIVTSYFKILKRSGYYK